MVFHDDPYLTHPAKSQESTCFFLAIYIYTYTLVEYKDSSTKVLRALEYYSQTCHYSKDPPRDRRKIPER